jgi:hypothetical protein|tara:strand:+ start:6540 stop:6725 length:186 start_codon:yes stop_codon:yes gene_type:complete
VKCAELIVGGESQDAHGKKDEALQGKRSTLKSVMDYHTKTLQARVVRNEQTGTAQPPGQIW